MAHTTLCIGGAHGQIALPKVTDFLVRLALWNPCANQSSRFDFVEEARSFVLSAAQFGNLLRFECVRRMGGL